MSSRKQVFEEKGFILEQVLSATEVDAFRGLMAGLLDPKKGKACAEAANNMSINNMGNIIILFNIF